MSWVSIADNQLVSYTNLRNAVTTGVLSEISPGTPFTSTDRWVVKSDLIGYVNVDTGNSYLSAKSSSQWVAKRDIASTVTGSIGILWWKTGNPGTTIGGWPTTGDACTNAGGGAAGFAYVYSPSSVFTTGTVLYYNSTLSIPATNTSTYFWFDSDSSGTFTFNSSTSGSGTSLTVGTITVCKHAINWTHTDSITTGDESFDIIINGITVVNTSTTSSGQVLFSPGDTVRIRLRLFATNGYYETLSITGGISYSSTGYDTSGDTGTVTPSDNITIVSTIS